MASKIKGLVENIYMIISEKLGVAADEITLDSHLADDLGADSLDLVELLMEIEERYNIAIDDDVAEGLYTPRKIVDYLNKRINHLYG